ncbi:MAG: alpha/beta hydrolase [Gammaproteobacteria bacterium]
MFSIDNVNRINLTSEVIPLKNDYEGEVSAAVEYSVLPEADIAVLYIHGYMDYFFQYHLASYFVDLGISFYAIELRKYGSSIKNHQHENYFKNIVEYDEEISIVLNKIKKEGHSKIILNGHSTGGLIATHYMLQGKYRHLISGMILNSPFLELNVPKLMKFILPIVSPLAYLFPYLKFTKLPSIYTESMHRDYKGRWDFNLEYKPIPSFISYFGWVRAILTALKEVHNQTIETIPCVIFHSDKSCYGATWDKLMLHSDAVLNVDDIIFFGRKIYPKAEIIEIKNATHDIVLSSDEVIDDYFTNISKWLNKYFFKL